MLILALILGISLSISFLCSLLEACLLSIGSADLALLDQQSARLGRTWRGFKDNLQHPLAAILILNTLAHTLGATFAGAEFEKHYGEDWLLGFSILVTFVMIQWTEILPKALGARYNRALAPIVAAPLAWAILLLKPVVRLIHALNRPFERGDARRGPSTVEEIRALARFALVSRTLEPPQERMISGMALYSELPVGDLMVPREEMSFLSLSMTPAEALIKAHCDSHTRYPLCEGNDPDRVVGYVNFKELVAILRTNPADGTLRGIARPIRSVAPDVTVAALLSDFAREHQHLAVVRDPAGATVGLITLEDILETPLGNLLGELDTLPTMFHALSATVYMAGGGVPAAQAAARIGAALDQPAGTLSDWMIARLGRPPRPGDTLAAGGARFTVRRVRRHRVFEAMIELAAPPA